MARRKRILPDIRNRDLENALIRNIDLTTDKIRAEMVSKTGGDPIVDFAGKSNPYIDYHRNDLLHSLQHMRSDAYDEFPFILMTQIKELIFRAIHYELANMQARIRAEDVSGALHLFPRVRREMELLVKTWDVLSTITAAGFNEFRDKLGSSSGQQSYVYRHIEFILGNKSDKLADAHKNNPDVYPAIFDALNSSSLYDDVLILLGKRGYKFDAHVLSRDWSKPYVFNQTVEDAWLEIYNRSDPDDELYNLAECLIEIDDLFTQYRWRHFISVQRILGLKPGTGGSAGVGWLRHATELRFFPELWSLRTSLEA